METERQSKPVTEKGSKKDRKHKERKKREAGKAHLMGSDRCNSRGLNLAVQSSVDIHVMPSAERDDPPATISVT